MTNFVLCLTSYLSRFRVMPDFTFEQTLYLSRVFAIYNLKKSSDFNDVAVWIYGLNIDPIFYLIR